MSSALPPIYLRAPNHLGDGVMALPALQALAERAEKAWIAAPAWGKVLYRDLAAEWIPTGRVPDDARFGVLFAPSLRVAIEARRLWRRIGLDSDNRGMLLTDPVRPQPGHRREEYAAIARVLGVEAAGVPRFQPRPKEIEAWARAPVHVGLNPISPSGPPVEWPWYLELARRLTEPVRVYAGPGEIERAAECVPGFDRFNGLDLADLAGMASRCRLLVSNDSGFAHFAAAVGCDVLVLHGSTSPERTGVAGARCLEGPDPGCRPCYRKRCMLSDNLAPCLAGLPVERVLQALS